MKPLKLSWKRGNPQDPTVKAIYGDLKAFYEAKGKVKIGGSPVSYQAIAVNPSERSRGTDPWRVTVQIGSHKSFLPGKTFTEVKSKSFDEIKRQLEEMDDEVTKKLALIAQIRAIYEAHGQKPRAGFDGHSTSGLKKHLEALQAGNFPWKMPAAEIRREAPSKESPAAGRVVRIPVAESTRDLVLRQVKAALERRVQEKGDGAFVSIHELRGALDEEWDELTDAMHSKDLGRIEAELMDWIVGGVFGLACIRAGVLK